MQKSEKESHTIYNSGNYLGTETLSMSVAQEETYNSYEYLVHITVSKIVSGRLPDSVIDRDDLLQYGRVALIRAIKACTAEKLLKPFAIKVIRNALLSAIRRTSDRASMLARTVGHINNDSLEWEQLGSNIASSDIDIDIDYEQSTICVDILTREAQRCSGNRRKGVICYIDLSKGYTCLEIANKYGVPTSTVYCWMREAKPMLLRSRELRETLGVGSQSRDE